MNYKIKVYLGVLKTQNDAQCRIKKQVIGAALKRMEEILGKKLSIIITAERALQGG